MAATTLTTTDMRISRMGRFVRRTFTLSAIPDTSDWHDFVTGLNYVYMASYSPTDTATDNNILVVNVTNADVSSPGMCKIKTTVANTDGVIEVVGR